jgi:drug/metabolite transporter (DMT)-like permease
MPIFGLTLAFLFLKESLTIIQLMGSALVVITILKINSIS